MIKYLFLIFVLMISCSTRHEEELVIYFDDGDMADAPPGFPNFSDVERKQPDLIYEFDDIAIDYFTFSELIKKIDDALPLPKTGKIAYDFSKINCVYLLFPDSTKNCFFNSKGNFYNTQEEFLFHDIKLATGIKRLINYDEVLEAALRDDIPPTLYYKVAVKVDHEEK